MTPSGEEGQKKGRKVRKSFERKEALLFAAPYMIFFVLPILFVFYYPNEWRSWATLITGAVLAVTYVISWLVNPAAPRRQMPSRTQTVTTSLLIIAWVSMVLVGTPELYWNLMYSGFIASPWVFQTSRRLIVPGLCCLIALTVGMGLIVGADIGSIFAGVGSALGTGIVCLIARLSIEKQRDKDLDVSLQYQLKRDEDRRQLSSDLHDILGQDLTGLSVKAQLVERLIEKGMTEEAKVHVKDIANMSHQALEDVRAVVAVNRQWSLSQELDVAKKLLDAGGIEIQITQKDDIYLTAKAEAYARVIREASTNILNHSLGDKCWILIQQDQLIITNDGYDSKYSRKTSGSQCGLGGLKESVSSIGILSWGNNGDKWEVKLVTHFD